MFEIGTKVAWKGNLVSTREDFGPCQNGQCVGSVTDKANTDMMPKWPNQVTWDKVCKRHRVYWSDETTIFTEWCNPGDLAETDKSVELDLAGKVYKHHKDAGFTLSDLLVMDQAYFVLGDFAYVLVPNKATVGMFPYRRMDRKDGQIIINRVYWLEGVELSETQIIGEADIRTFPYNLVRNRLLEMENMSDIFRQHGINVKTD